VRGAAVPIGSGSSEKVRFDFASPATYAAALEGVRKVFLLLPADPRIAAWTQNFAQQAKKAGVERIVKLSAMGAERETTFAFARWHREADSCLQSSGVPHVILRPNGFMQNYLRFHAATIRTRGLFFLPTEQAKISHVDAEDVAAAAVAALLAERVPESAYTLTGPAALSNEETAWIFSVILGREIRYVPISPEQADEAMLSRGLPEAHVRAVAEMMADYRAGNASRVSDSVFALTGRPARSLAEFVQSARSEFGDSPSIKKAAEPSLAGGG
jgi:uncharacterized protein YbjT (DUF2867 family)